MMVICAIVYAMHYFFGPSNRKVAFAARVSIIALGFYMLFCTLFLCISNIYILSTLSNLIEGREPIDLRRHISEKALMYLLFGIYISLYYIASITCLLYTSDAADE
eukprot:TRINITY_DN8325_c0_g1_i6.p2 TRINITY_DN8325_c0_g1~~TRINITY_DN8325_c0_g1_i6.p2  ORF type:complete len:106 (-),score=32.13 TRINITY_DN8325_c0_g1_i6:52-369(-)